MRAVLCKNVPAVRDFRDVICRAAWKNSGSVCGHVAPFSVFPEFFSDFLPFGGGILAGISQLGEKNGRRVHFFRLPAGAELAVFGKFLSSGWQKKWSFSRNFCPSAGIKLAISWEFPSFGWHKNGLSREILLLWLA